MLLRGAIFFSDAFLAEHILNLTAIVPLARRSVPLVSLLRVKELLEVLLDPMRGLAFGGAKQGDHRMLLLLVCQAFDELI